jgi:hypothetical protein
LITTTKKGATMNIEQSTQDPDITVPAEPKSKWFYAGFLEQIQKSSADKGEMLITLTPTNFQTLKQMLLDYSTLEQLANSAALITTAIY